MANTCAGLDQTQDLEDMYSSNKFPKNVQRWMEVILRSFSC
jgi:hypothetical protein